MIYIAESGSTKCDSVLLDNQGNIVEQFSHMGFNPYFHSSELVFRKLNEIEVLRRRGYEVKKAYFYGAGCSAPHLTDIIAKGLAKIFTNAKIIVDHDLLAAAYSTYQGEPEIACIVGTGSNSCFFDGKNYYEEVPALAYVLGDEGSASYLGKKLLSGYLYKQLPKHIAEDFYNTYKLDKNDIITKVYNEPNANVFLANFSQFIGKHKDEEYFKKMTYEGFKVFLETHVLCFKEAREVQVNFVGSVAYHFQEQLYQAGKDLGLNLGSILRKPLQGLIDFHIKHLGILETAKKNY
jgi:N-acetylglucosamine kinase-like BadF-type ATPase